MTYAKRPLPPCFRETCTGKTFSEVRNHYRAHTNTLHRWYAECGIEPDMTHGKIRALPADFVLRAKTMTKRELRDHYHCSSRAIQRWLQETGVSAQAYVQPKGRPQNWTGVKQGVKRSYGNLVHTTTYTTHDRAADDLRRERFVVYRCDDRGRANPKGGMWRVGNVVCTPDELLARADRYRRKAA